MRQTGPGSGERAGRCYWMPLKSSWQKTINGGNFAPLGPGSPTLAEANWENRLNSRPKISVCVAAYQGRRYIALQLRSILQQLTTGDEVIVVDDSSTDGTYDEARKIQDTRLLVLRNAANQGVLRTFEKALSHCSGEIIFLSDQDDIWLPKKVETVLNVFVHDPEVTLIASD